VDLDLDLAKDESLTGVFGERVWLQLLVEVEAIESYFPLGLQELVVREISSSLCQKAWLVGSMDDPRFSHCHSME